MYSYKANTTCTGAVMTSLRGNGRSRLEHRAPDSSSTQASGTVQNCCNPIVIDVPSFTECIPTNITWTGGTAPYSVFINVRDSSQNLRQFVNINTPHFVWSPDVPAQTLVSLQVIDTRNVLTLIEDPILIEQKPLGASCVASTLSSSVPVPTTTQSPSTGMSRNPISSGVIAAIVLGAVILLGLLATLRWWFFRVRARRRRKENGHGGYLAPL